MGFETGFIVGGISIITLAISKIKCYYKKNGSLSYGCGFMDKNLFDDDELEIKQMDLGDVKILYVKPKHHTPVPSHDNLDTVTDEEI
jgi:hypothetical protein